MRLEHAAKPPEDLADRKAVRFYFRGERDLVPCEVSWQALHRLENHAADNRAERLAVFEKHRSGIEQAAHRKAKSFNGGTLLLDADDVLSELK